MAIRSVLVAVVLVSVPGVAASQSLADIARKTEESRKTVDTPGLKVDHRDIDPRVNDPELMEFRFDTARWERLVAADVWTSQAVDRNPALYERLSAAQVQSVRSLERVMAREPEFQTALKSAGSDPHEFAYANGAMALGLILIQNELTPEQLERVPPAVKANMEFLRAHMAEVQGMIARAAQIKKRMEKR